MIYIIGIIVAIIAIKLTLSGLESTGNFPRASKQYKMNCPSCGATLYPQIPEGTPAKFDLDAECVECHATFIATVDTINKNVEVIDPFFFEEIQGKLNLAKDNKKLNNEQIKDIRESIAEIEEQRAPLKEELKQLREEKKQAPNKETKEDIEEDIRNITELIDAFSREINEYKSEMAQLRKENKSSKNIHITYKDASGKITERNISISSIDKKYINAIDLEINETRTFRIDRIIEISDIEI